MPVARRLADPPPEEPPPVRLREQCEDQIAPPVEVVRRDQQLAKTGLAEVLGQQLGVALSQVFGTGPRDRRRAAHQRPQSVSEPAQRATDVERRPEQRPPQRPPHPTRRAGPHPGQPGRPDQHPEQERQRDHDQPGQPDGQCRRCEDPLDKLPEPGRQPLAPGQPDDLEQIGQRVDQRREHDHAERQHQRAKRGTENPGGGTQRESPAVEPRRAPGTPQTSRVPELRGAVDRRKRCAHRANAAPRHQVDLDAGLVQRPQHAGMIRAGGSGAGQHQRCSDARRVTGS